MRSGWCVAAVVTTLSAASCSQGDPPAGGPTTGQYQIVFPSTVAAVDSDSVEVYEFDSTAPGADCLSLVATRQAHAALPDEPVLLADSGAMPTCDLAAGGGTLVVTYGPRSLLAVAQRCGRDLLLGCAQADIESSDAIVTIYVAQANLEDPLPASTCMTLSDRCGDAGCAVAADVCGDGGS